ncbi:MAG TPA: hypothetical protein VMH00_05220 [Candidatus Limnocylindrales bacterium]|nr:hypothetical protein [Candidatus Limnocylindrales bacterium]
MIASGNPELQGRLTGEAGGAILALVAISFALSKSWKQLQLREPDADPSFRRKHKRFTRATGAPVVLCLGVAIVFGVQRGNCDATVAQFTSDITQSQSDLKSIGDTRRSVDGSLESYIQMYRSLEPKVAQARALIARMRNEIPRCGDFQTRAERFAVILGNLDQRMTVLSKEIEVAKSIESSPADERESRWQAELVPLFDEETSLERQMQTAGEQ